MLGWRGCFGIGAWNGIGIIEVWIYYVLEVMRCVGGNEKAEGKGVSEGHWGGGGGGGAGWE